MYQVKFTDDDVGVVYGLADKHSTEGLRAAAQGKVRVRDVLTGQPYVVDPLAVTDIPIGVPVQHSTTGVWVNDDEIGRYIAEELRKAEEVSASLPALAEGKLFTVGVADGCAYYLVTHVAKKLVRVEWRGFHPDAWRCPVLGMGGQFPRAYIEKFL